MSDLIELQQRHQKLLRELAVLEAREQEKAQRREALRAKLQAEGVDPDRPEEELARLEAETEAELKEAERLLDEFELKLRGARDGNDISNTVEA